MENAVSEKTIEINGMNLNFQRIAERMRKRKILLIEGTHSEENLKYKYNPLKPERGIDAIVAAFDSLKLNFKKIDSTDEGLFEEILISDAVFNYAHGDFGEDGRLQGLIEYAGKPYIGPDVAGSAICNDKLIFKRPISSEGIKTAPFYAIEHTDDLDHLKVKCGSLGYPVMVKLRACGSSIGITKVSNDQELAVWFSAHSEKKDKYFIEKWITGRFITVGVIEDGSRIYTLTPLTVETVSDFYDEETKLGVNKSLPEPDYIQMESLPNSKRDQISKTAQKIFRVTECKKLSRIDFIEDSNGNYNVLEVNTIPGMAKNSNFIKMLESHGLSYNDIVLYIMHICYEH
jgi:D-alanine-D-alanine ligase